MTNMRQSSYDEQEEFGGVYLGPPECNKIQKCIGNTNGRYGIRHEKNIRTKHGNKFLHSCKSTS